jgi:hypothetical protein
MDIRCAAYVMSQLESRRLRGEYWDSSFSSSFGKLATKLYRDLYKKSPKKRYSRRANRNSVNLFPCGILEQAYTQLRSQGVELVKPGSALARRQEREEQEYRDRDKDPLLDPRYRAQQAFRDAVYQRALQTKTAVADALGVITARSLPKSFLVD